MNGIIIINKPIGFTSQDVVSKVKKILNEKKTGHTGTLDPLATGVLPVLLGDATKLSKYLVEHDKKYIATIKLGEKRDTGDAEGKIIEESNVRVLDENKIKEVLKSFIGKQKQTPPMYSSVKINGKKLYEYARKGEKIDVPQRDIEIYEINHLGFDEEKQEIKFEVGCSKGTYIRVLCEDIAKALGTCGYMSSLIRTKVDKFDIKDAITFEELEKIKYEKLIKPEEIFETFPKINLNKRKEELFLNGVKLTFEVEDGLYNIYSNNEYIGIGIVKDRLLKRDVVLKNS